MITVNPRALAIADSLDRERAPGRIHGPLHGIPVALKDNIHTTDMPTTGGALAFAGLVPPYEATLTKNLEAAGAIILAKTQLTELANWVASGMPGNYNGLNGYGMNPWDPRRDPRDAFFDGRPVLSTGGSSSGAGTNVSFWMANVGTETSGSILSPSNQNMLVGIKPSVGRVSRYGVIPITADQDTPGPMTRSVSDAAIMLGAMEARPRPERPGDAQLPAAGGPRLYEISQPRRRSRARASEFRARSSTSRRRPVPPRRAAGLNDAQRAMMKEVIATLRQQGAVIVDPSRHPERHRHRPPAKNFINWNPCSGLENAKGLDIELLGRVQVRHEARLQRLAAVARRQGAGEDADRAAAVEHRAPARGRDQVRPGAARHLRRDGSAGRPRALRVGSPQGHRALGDERHRRGAQGESSRRAALSRREQRGHRGAAGLPDGDGSVRLLPVPPGTGATAFPAGFDPKPAPFNVSFTGTMCSEPKLIALAYAFEQVTKKRAAPPQFP